MKKINFWSIALQPEILRVKKQQKWIESWKDTAYGTKVISETILQIEFMTLEWEDTRWRKSTIEGQVSDDQQERNEVEIF